MKALCFLILLLSFNSFALDQRDVIYGDDNRKDVFESTDAVMVNAASATAAMIPKNLLHSVSMTEYAVRGKSLESRGICKKERFSQQMTAAQCSGFLVKKNRLVTAGHCIKDAADCAAFRWVFDYKVTSSTQTQMRVKKSAVYSCKRIIARAQNPIDQNDYALIELTRKSVRTPLPVRRSGLISVKTPVVVIGNPSGLPTKISDGANVRSVAGKFFTANLDTYGGNSGSAVLNAATGEVEGILVRGENDYVDDESGTCLVSNVCSNTACRGEDVTFIQNIPGLR